MAQINKPTDYFNTKLYTGNLSTNAITGVGFQPDFCWLKSRTQGGTGYDGNHFLFDNVRGVQKYLRGNLTNAEGTLSTSLTSFDSDGFTLGALDNINNSGDSFVSWNWLASNTTASNTDGSITSTVSANTTSGFSIVSWTGNGTAGATIGHSLGTTPSMIITKSRSAGGGWYTYHKSEGATKFFQLSTNDGSTSNSTIWNNTEPTSSVFSTGTAFDNGTTYIAYCFAEKKGFSKFGSYTGNGNADGTFVYTGFKPAWLMVKRTDSTESWGIIDNKRQIYNPNNTRLFANLNVADDTSELGIDLLSNGFKIRNSWLGNNASGGSYFYMCFAESPLVGTNNIPATAR